MALIKATTLITTVCFCVRQCYSLAVLSETDVVWRRNTTCHLSCTVTPSRDVSAADLYFKLNDTDLTEFTNVMNDTTAQLIWTPRDILTGVIYCLSNTTTENQSVLAQTSVAVGEPPMKPAIVGCYNENCKRMVCQWSPTASQQRENTGLVTTQTLMYSYRAYPHVPCDKVNKDESVCSIRDYLESNASFFVTSVNSLGRVSSGNWTFGPQSIDVSCCHIKFRVYTVFSRPHSLSACKTISEDSGVCTFNLAVVPLILIKANNSLGAKWDAKTDNYPVHVEQVRNLRIKTVTNTSFEIRWRKPRHYLCIGSYQLNITSILPNTNYALNKNQIQTKYTAVNLRPNTRYNVSVIAVPHRDNYISATSYIEVLTHAGVPESSPEHTTGSFVIDSTSHTDKRIVQFYWKALPVIKRNGNITGIKLTYIRACDSNDTSVGCGVTYEKVVEGDANTISSHLELDRHSDYEIFIDAKTSVGYNNNRSESPWSIDSQERVLAGPREVVAERDGLSVDIRWSDVEGASSYAVYWCRGLSRVMKCQGSFDWVRLPANYTGFRIALLSDSEHLVGVSVEQYRAHHTSSSGIHWADCVYQANQELSPPVNVRLSKVQDSGSISLHWEHPRCQLTSYIEYFRLFYCMLDECQTFENTKVDRRLTNFTLRNLHPGQKYAVYMRSVSSHEKSQSDKSETLTVLAAGPRELGTLVLIAICTACLVVVVVLLIGLKTCVQKTKEMWKVHMLVKVTMPSYPTSYNSQLTDQEQRDSVVRNGDTYYRVNVIDKAEEEKMSC